MQNIVSFYQVFVVLDVVYHMCRLHFNDCHYKVLLPKERRVCMVRWEGRRHSGLMDSVLDSGVSSPGLSPSWGTLCCVLG